MSYLVLRRRRRAFAHIREVRAEWHVASVEETITRILSVRFGDREATAGVDGESTSLDLAKFQADAVDAAQRILSARRGVLIADSVGLGKTYVGLGLIERALRSGSRIAVVSPAALRREWEAPLRRLVRDTAKANPRGSGSAPPVPSGPPRRVPRPLWISHGRLSRGGYSATHIGRLDLIVVDEAHAFRNPRTRRYRALAELCRGARVVLLTATPVNNTLFDLYFQLRLFAGDGAFRDLGVPDLATTFRLAQADSGGHAATALDSVLRSVVIRRTRSLLRRQYGPVEVPGRRGGSIAALPRRAPPVAIRYTLGDLRPGFHAQVMDCLGSLTLAPFRLAGYGMPFAPASGGEAELIRLSLLKRLESSIAAFAVSVRRQLHFYRAFLDALEAGRLLAPADHGTLHGTEGDADVIQLIMHEVALREVPRGVETGKLRADARADQSLLRSVLAGLDEPLAAIDPKIRRLRDLLDRQIGHRKAVLFTEFRDTARHLWRVLRTAGRVGLVDGDGAFLGAAPAGRRAVVERFAPHSNNAPEPNRRERVDLLIATDVLAEGLNLQDADTVISYDLPWNPVKLIQRVGRIDRLGSPFSIVHSYHFLPDRDLERALGLVSRLRSKLGAIGRSVGGEAPVLMKGETVTQDFNAFVDRLAEGDPDVLEDEGRAAGNSLDAEETLRAAYLTLSGRSGSRSGVANRRGGGGSESAPASVIPVPAVEAHVLVLAYEIGGKALSFVFDAQSGTVEEDAERTDRILMRALELTETCPGGVSSGMQRRSTAEELPGLDARSPVAIPAPTPLREPIVRAIAATEALVAAREAVLLAAERVHVQAPGARLARHLLAALHAIPGGPDPGLCRRSDRLLSRLSRSQPAGTEKRLGDLLNGEVVRSGASSPEALVAAIENALDLPADRAARSDHPTDGALTGSSASLLGILELRPAC